MLDLSDWGLITHLPPLGLANLHLNVHNNTDNSSKISYKK